MKKLIIFLLLVLILTGCVAQNETEKTDEVSDNKTDVIIDEDTNEAVTEDSKTEIIEDEPNNKTEVKPEEDVENKTEVKDEQTEVIENEATRTFLALGDYGDYVCASDNFTGHVETEFNRLSTKHLGIQNGNFQTNYEQGLLDLFDINNEIKISIIISEEELNKLDKDHNQNNRETYRMCDLKIEYHSLVFYYKEVGIRQKGNTSRGNIVSDGKINLRHYKLNFAETFDDEFTDNPKTWTDEAAKLYREDRDFFGLEKLDIRWNRNRDATYLKEYYAYEMYRANGVLAPRSNLMNVCMVVDGKTHNMGVYLGVETIDKQFIKRNLIKEARDGDLYKLGWTNSGATLNKTDSYYFGVEYQTQNGDHFDQHKFVYDLKNNKKTSDHSAIKSFIRTINTTSSAEFYSAMKMATDYDSFISYLAVAYLLGDPDDLRGNFNNTYLYFNPQNNQVYFIPTDNDRSLGATGGGGNPTGNHAATVKPFARKTGYSENYMPLFEKSIISTGNETIKSDYLNRIGEVINNNWLEEATFKKCFDLSKSHYNDDLSLGDKINNSEIDFSMTEVDNLSDGWNLSIGVYLKTKKNTYLNYINGDVTEDNYNQDDNPSGEGNVTHPEGEASVYYIVGIGNWSISEKYNLKIQDGKAMIEVTINAGTEFKIRNCKDNSELMFKHVKNPTNCVGGGGEAIKMTKSGTYLIEVVLPTKAIYITEK